MKLATLAVLAVVCNLNAAFAAGESEAYKLASIDSNQLVPKNGIEEKRAQAAIIAARAVCDVASDQIIVGQAVKVTNILAEEKIFSRPIDILEGVSAVLADSKQKTDCTKVLSQYATIRHTGFTHSGAIASMRVIFNASQKLLTAK